MVKGKIEMPSGFKSVALRLFPKRRDSRVKRRTERSDIGQSEADYGPFDEVCTISPLPNFSTNHHNLNGSVARRTLKFPATPQCDPHNFEPLPHRDEPQDAPCLQRPFRPNKHPSLFIETSSGPVPFLSFDDYPSSPTPSESTDDGDYGPERLFGERVSSPPQLILGDETGRSIHQEQVDRHDSRLEPRCAEPTTKNATPAISNTLGTFYCLQVRTTGLLQSFCVLDTQLPGKPICVGSKDMIPSGSYTESEALFIEDDLGEDTLRIDSSERDGVAAHHLLLKHDLVPLGSNETSHEVISQIDITNLTLPTTDNDVWLQLATEEMKRLAIWNKILLSHLPVLPSPFEDLPDDVQQNINYIQAFNSFSFVISQSNQGSNSLELTHISRHWLAGSEDFIPAIVQGFNEGLPKLGKHLSKGQRFFFDIRLDLSMKQQMVCCIPMFGPKLSCWLCFLISGPIFDSCLATGSFS